MFNKKLLAIIINILLINTLCSSSGNVKAIEKNILILHSYNSGLSWTDNINKGIFESFKNDYHRTIDLRVEYMDAKHFEDSIYFKLYKDFLLRKYKNINIDLVICADNPAYDFLTANHNQLFKDKPIVFCGLNYCDSIPKGFTGVMEDVDIYSNLQTILTLHPDYHKLYVINDKSITGRSVNKEMLKVIQSNFPTLNFEVLTHYTLDELKTKLNSLDKRDIILMLLFNFDRTGQAISYDVILDDIIPYCHVPMYGVWDFYIGKGIVGGKITNAYEHGIKASKIAKEILNGKDISTIPIISGPTRYLYDYEILKKFNINKSLLPANATIINRPFEFIANNKTFFSLIAIIFALLIILIVILIFLIRRGNNNLRKEKEYTEIIKAKSEELKIALEKADLANKLKSSFLSNISHEIRTPMNGILGFANLLEYEEDFSIQKEYIHIINSNAKKLLTVISDILEISRIESNQVQINKRIISVNEILKNAKETFKKDANEKNISISLSMPQTHDQALLETDDIKLHQIFNNLLSNAIKFSESGQIALGYVKKENQFLFYCQDEGIGILPENQSLIFEPFNKIEQSNNKLYGGNGLGLAITKGHIKLLGGKIWITSTPQKGTTVYFTIPKTQIQQ